MATTTLPSSGDGEHSIAVPPADGNAADDKVMWKQLKRLNDIVFFIELLEYSGNAIGTVAFLWATVVLLGGFCSLLSRLDFWFATVMVFLEGTRVFISKDTSVNQWLFGSTRAFRWDHFSFSDMHGYWNLFAVIIGASISLAPVVFGSQIITGILKVAILAITSQLLTRTHRGLFVIAVLTLFALAGVGGSFYGFVYKIHKFGFQRVYIFEYFSWLFGTWFGVAVIGGILNCIAPRYGKSKRVFWLKVIVASGLVCLPLLAKLGPYNCRYFSISIAAALQTVNWPEDEDPPEQEQSSNALLLGTWKLLLKIVDTIMSILFFWGVMFPLPGISLKVSFYMLLSVIAAVLVGNLQIPVAFLQILLSSLRLHSLLAGRDYHSLPDGASPNLVPSIVVFYVLELCQGSCNILGIILGLVSFACRRSLVRVLRLTEEWGAKAVNLYYHQACMTLKENGLFPMLKLTPPSLDSFAIESLGCTSSEMQIVRLHVLDYYLQQGDSKSKRKFIAQIAKDAAGIVTKIMETISHLITDEEILSSGNDIDTDTDTLTVIVILKQKLKQKQKKKEKQKQKQIRSSLSLSLNFVWRLAVAGGKIGTRFRQELSGNPILLHSLQRILDMEDCPQELWKPTMDVIKLLALHDEATAKEIGSTHAVIPKLMGVFLNKRGDVKNLRHDRDGSSLRKDAGEVLENLTITSSDNCRTILDMEAGPGRHDLIKKLISMLKDDNYMSVAANLLHNLCANSGDILIDLGAKEDLKSALQMVMQIIIGNDNDNQHSEISGNRVVKQLHAALCVASQIGYIIPQDFAHVLAEKNLAPNTDAAAKKIVGKLVDTLKSNREPNPEYPRLRRFLIGTVISIMELCPDECIEIFRENGVEDAQNMLKGTSSRLERYMVFVGDEGMVPESAPTRDLVDKAKTKLRPETKPTKNAQPSNRGL